MIDIDYRFIDWLRLVVTDFQQHFHKKKNQEFGNQAFDWLWLSNKLTIFARFKSISIKLNAWIDIQFNWVQLAMLTFMHWFAVHSYTIPTKLLEIIERLKSIPNGAFEFEQNFAKSATGCIKLCILSTLVRLVQQYSCYLSVVMYP